MQISSRFTIAIHILICVDLYGADAPATSESLAGSIGVPPVVIRRILGARGREGGAHIVRPLGEITLADVFRAVESIGSDTLFSFHENPNPACPVGRNIHNVLDGHLAQIQRAMEHSMEQTTLADVIAETRERVGEEA